MSDSDEIFISNEERDLDRMENILRHSTRRQETPVMLVQLPTVNRPIPDSEFPQSQESGRPRRGSQSRTSQRRATIVNTAGAPAINFEEDLDPIEWHFRQNTGLRTSLVREGVEDGLCSRRKSRVGDTQMEQMVLMLSTQSANRYPIVLGIEESDRTKVNNTTLQPEEEKLQSTTEPLADVRRSTLKLEDDLGIEQKLDEGNEIVESNGNEEYDEATSEEGIPIIDAIMSSLNKEEDLEMTAKPDEKPPINETKINSVVDPNKEITIMPAQYSPINIQYSNKQSPLNETKKKTVVNFSKEITVMPAVNSFTDQKSPFKETGTDQLATFFQDITVAAAEYSFADQKSPFKKDRDEIRPRPSSRVRVLIMLDEWDSLEEENRRDGPVGGKGKKGRGKDKRGGRKGSEESHYDETREEFVTDESPLKGNRKDKSDRGRQPSDNKYKGGGGSQRGGKPSHKDDDWDDRDKDRRGRKPGDRDYDKDRYGDGARPRGDYGEGYDDDDKSKRGRRSVESDYDKNKYGDGTRSEGPDKRTYEDIYGDKKRKGRPGGDHDVTKYRSVLMPKSATTLTSRRRYHLQITDHDMKEPWFNSCFNISKDNNVDLNYEGPVKITPYYIGDKFY